MIWYDVLTILEHWIVNLEKHSPRVDSKLTGNYDILDTFLSYLYTEDCSLKSKKVLTEKSIYKVTLLSLKKLL